MSGDFRVRIIVESIDDDSVKPAVSSAEFDEQLIALDPTIAWRICETAHEMVTQTIAAYLKRQGFLIVRPTLNLTEEYKRITGV